MPKRLESSPMTIYHLVLNTVFKRAHAREVLLMISFFWESHVWLLHVRPNNKVTLPQHFMQKQRHRKLVVTVSVRGVYWKQQCCSLCWIISKEDGRTDGAARRVLLLMELLFVGQRGVNRNDDRLSLMLLALPPRPTLLWRSTTTQPCRRTSI